MTIVMCDMQDCIHYYSKRCTCDVIGIYGKPVSEHSIAQAVATCDSYFPTPDKLKEHMKRHKQRQHDVSSGGIQ